MFVDVGANVGYYTLIAARRVGPQGRVIAFEPVPRNVAFLHRHLALNRVTNVTILPVACAERQGVEDFDIVTELTQAWRSDLDRLAPKAKELDAAGIARAAIIAPVMLSMSKATDCGARAEALRLLAGNELEAARQQPTVLCYPIRDDNGQLAISGFAEPGTQLTLNGAPVALDADGRFSLPVSDDALATGMAWTAENAGSRKTWAWPGVR